MGELKENLAFLLIGQSGGENRFRIIELLKDRPSNINQISNKLDLNYRTVRHHIDVLMEHDLVVSAGEDYGKVYLLSSKLEDNMDVFENLNQKREDIETSDELYQKVLEQMHNGIIITDEEKDVIFINQNGEDILGYPSKDILGNPVDFFKESDFFEKNIEKISGGEEVSGIETTAVSESGEELYLRVTLDKIEDEEVLGYSIIFEDLTEQKRMEEEIRESERRFKVLFDESPIGIWEEDFSAVNEKVDELKENGVKDIEKYLDENPELVEELMKEVEIISINESVLDMYRADSIEEFTDGLSDIFVEDSIASFKEVIKKIAEGETEYKTDKVDKRLDGEDIHIFLQWSVVSGYEDDYSRVIVSTIDITERKEKERNLKRSKERLDRTQEVANVGMWKLDLETEDLTWSDETYNIFGLSPDEPMDYQKFLNNIHPEDRDYVDKEWKNALNGAEYDIEHRILVDGDVKWVREKADIKFNEESEPVNVIGSVQDITERKEARERIEFLNSLIESTKDVNQELLKNDDFDEVIREVPSILLGTKGFTNITISMFREDDIMRPVSNAGIHDIGDWELTRGGKSEYAPECIVRSIKNKGEVIVDKEKQFCNDCVLSDDIPEHQTVVIPMFKEGTIIGTIRACYEPEIEIDEKSRELLREVAEDLIYAYKIKQ